MTFHVKTSTFPVNFILLIPKKGAEVRNPGDKMLLLQLTITIDAAVAVVCGRSKDPKGNAHSKSKTRSLGRHP